MRKVLTLTVVSVCLLYAGCEKSHETKAKDWMEIGDFEKARSEIEAALGKDPKNVTARIILVEAILKQSQFTNEHHTRSLSEAVQIINDIEVINAKSADIERLKVAVYQRIGMILNKNTIKEVISFISRYPSLLAIDTIENSINFADESDLILIYDLYAKLDPIKCDSFFVLQLSSRDTDIKERAATVLWEKKLHADAKHILRAKFLRNLRATNGQTSSLVKRLLDLGYADVSKDLIDLSKAWLQDNSRKEDGLVIFKELIDYGDSQLAEIARMGIGYNSVQLAQVYGCTHATSVFTIALAKIRAPANSVALRHALSYLILFDNSRFDNCLARYVEALASNDGTDWLRLRLWYSNWPIFTTVIPGRIQSIREGNEYSGWGGQEWHLFGTPPNAAREKLTSVLKRLGPYSLFSGGRNAQFVPTKVFLEKYNRGRMTIAIVDTARSSAVGHFTLLIEASGSSSNQPWVITNVVEAFLDGQRLL